MKYPISQEYIKKMENLRNRYIILCPMDAYDHLEEMNSKEKELEKEFKKDILKYYNVENNQKANRLYDIIYSFSLGFYEIEFRFSKLMEII